jgi:hypothetical protein
VTVIYVVDTSSFHVLGNYYPETFPTFWQQLDALISQGRFVSCREVSKELEVQNTIEHLAQWAAVNEPLFPVPSAAEMQHVAAIFAVPHFQQLIGQKQRLRGSPVADPWLVARALEQKACVITEERHKPNAAKIPNVCEHFTVPWMSVQAMLKAEGWRY